MKIEALNIIKRKDKKWEYNGRFYFNSKWIPVIGTVGDFPTEAQMKKAIITRIKKQAESYKARQSIPQEKRLSADTVFKPTLETL
jgi:hypothetical protein